MMGPTSTDAEEQTSQVFPSPGVFIVIFLRVVLPF